MLPAIVDRYGLPPEPRYLLPRHHCRAALRHHRRAALRHHRPLPAARCRSTSASAQAVVVPRRCLLPAALRWCLGSWALAGHIHW